MLIHSSPYNFKSRWAGEAYSHLAPLTPSHVGRGFKEEEKKLCRDIKRGISYWSVKVIMSTIPK